MFPVRPRSCSCCAHAVRLRHAVRWRGRYYCGHACAAVVRAAHVKAHHDTHDPSPTVCRCAGAPRPLEAEGPHCARCRRMFSAGMRGWLVQNARRERRWRSSAVARWIDELSWQLRLGGLRT